MRLRVSQEESWKIFRMSHHFQVEKSEQISDIGDGTWHLKVYLLNCRTYLKAYEAKDV